MTEEVEANPISDTIDHIHNSEFEKASVIWNDAIGQRVGDALDQEKIAVAQSIYTIDQEDLDDETMEIDDEDDEFEVSDEDLEAAAADLEEV
jgi:hypothetical protein